MNITIEECLKRSQQAEVNSWIVGIILGVSIGGAVMFVIMGVI